MAEFWYENAGEKGDITRVVLSGELDAAGCEYLLECVEKQVANGYTKCVIDCTKLTYISSLGLGALVRVHSRMKNKGGDVKLAGVSGAISKVFSVVGLDKVFQMYPSLDEAIAALGG